MLAGQLKQKIVIQQPTESQNSYGEVTQSWSTFATVRAGIKPIRGGETFTAQQINSESTILFTLRYLSGVTTKMRVSYDSRTFDILFVDNGNETDKVTRLECKEQT